MLRMHGHPGCTPLLPDCLCFTRASAWILLYEQVLILAECGSMDRHEVQAEFLQAVGQTTRLRILEVLAEGERCVCEIYQAIGEEQSNVSKHLAILRRAGVLTARREGGRVVYRLRDARVSEFLRKLHELVRGDFFGYGT